MSRKDRVQEVTTKRKRTEMLAMAVHHNEQLNQLAQILNSSQAPRPEKLAFMVLAIEQRNDAQQFLTDTLRRASKSKLAEARNYLVKNPGIILKGNAYWCSSCQSRKVDRPNSLCPVCRKAKVAENQRTERDNEGVAILDDDVSNPDGREIEFGRPSWRPPRDPDAV